MKTNLLLWAMGAALVLSGCSCSPHIRVVGRIAFAEPTGCNNAVWSVDTDWPACHKLKRHFDPASGKEITATQMVDDALRPVPAAIELSYFKLDGSEKKLCSQILIQTDLDGMFNASVAGCGEGDNILVVGRAILQYRLRTDDRARIGYVRAIWREEEAKTFFTDIGTKELKQTTAFTLKGVKHATPEFVFSIEPGKEPSSTSSKPGVVSVGTQVFLSSAKSDEYGYLRQVLSAYQTVVELHNRMRLGVTDQAAYFDKMFKDDADTGLERHYLVSFTETWAYGGRGGISLFRPDPSFKQDGNKDGLPDGSSGVSGLISEVAVLSHEFGHSAHGAYGGVSLQHDYGFANPLTTKGGKDYDWGHGGNQYQEMGAAFSEGMANSIGQYLASSCERFKASKRPIGGVDPFSDNIWATDDACDADKENGCGYHHTRASLKKRGVADGSGDFTARAAKLKNLTTAAKLLGHRYVTSNSEFRVGEFGCDLLDRSSDVSHATGKVNDLSYIHDFTYNVGELLDGANPTVATAKYVGDPSPEGVTISLSELLESLEKFCPDCDKLPGSFGADYNTQRVSINGKISPQAFGKYMVSRGFVKEDQLKNLLKSNFMEE